MQLLAKSAAEQKDQVTGEMVRCRLTAGWRVLDIGLLA